MRLITALTQRDLARIVGVDPRNLVSVLDGLVDAKRLEPTIDPSDRRRRLLQLTRSGRRSADALAKGAADIERAFLDGLSAPQRTELNTLLRALMSARLAAAPMR